METTATNTPPRPARNAPEVIAIAAEKLLPDVMQWLGNGDEDLLEVLATIKLAIRYEIDGYAIAKSMEDNSFIEPDAELVEILDQASCHLRNALSEVCTEWVNQNRLTGPAIGAKVTSSWHPEAGTGEIIRNDKDGRSLVLFEALGHVKEGLGCHGSLINWEYLTTI